MGFGSMGDTPLHLYRDFFQSIEGKGVRGGCHVARYLFRITGLILLPISELRHGERMSEICHPKGL